MTVAVVATRTVTSPLTTSPASGASDAIPGDNGFVGGTNDAAVDLTQLGARPYDPARGMFFAADPVIDFTDPGQIAGAYAYAQNDPVTYSDPTGLRPIDDYGNPYSPPPPPPPPAPAPPVYTYSSYPGASTYYPPPPAVAAPQKPPPPPICVAVPDDQEPSIGDEFRAESKWNALFMGGERGTAALATSYAASAASLSTAKHLKMDPTEAAKRASLYQSSSSKLTTDSKAPPWWGQRWAASSAASSAVR